MVNKSLKKKWQTPKLFVMSASDNVGGGHTPAYHESFHANGIYYISSAKGIGNQAVSKMRFDQAHS